MALFQKKTKVHVVIVGCGRLGSSIACRISAQDYNIVVVDIDENAFRKLGASYGGLTVAGDGSDTDILDSVGIREATVLAAVTNKDDTNIMVAQIAKHVFNVKTVIARIRDTSKKIILQDMDIQTICPTELCITEFFHITQDMFGDDA